MDEIPTFLDRRTKKALSADLMACGVSITRDKGDGTIERVAPEAFFAPADPPRPRRISMGCYAIERGDRSVVIQREGRRGFKIVMRQGAMSPHFKRLRDAAATALDSINPWPFPVDPQQ